MSEQVKNPPASAERAPDTAPQFRMEDVVRRTDLTPRAIRYYEEVGLLAPSGRTAGGFRLFSEAEITRLLRIKELQTLLGFSLAEIKQTLHMDATRAELREAYYRTTDPAERGVLVDQAVDLIQSQIQIIDERMGRLAKLRGEYEERLERALTVKAQIAAEQSGSSADDGGLERPGH